MKAANTKSTGKSKKVSESAKAGTKLKSAARPTTGVTGTTVKKTTVRKSSARKNMPGEDQIRQKAHELYLQRIARGESGSEMDDWNRAIELLS